MSAFAARQAIGVGESAANIFLSVLGGVLFGVLLLRKKLFLMTGLWQGGFLLLIFQMWLVVGFGMIVLLPCMRGGRRVNSRGGHLGEVPKATRRMMT